MADRANFSVRHLSRLFEEQVGMSPSAYVERVRIEAVRTMLETGDESSAVPDARGTNHYSSRNSRTGSPKATASSCATYSSGVHAVRCSAKAKSPATNHGRGGANSPTAATLPTASTRSSPAGRSAPSANGAATRSKTVTRNGPRRSSTRGSKPPSQNTVTTSSSSTPGRATSAAPRTPTTRQKPHSTS